ncbi:MAG: hypothetical protein AAGA20_10410 [Planctomycetota bacterium]
MRTRTTALTLVASLGVATAQAQTLLIPESSNDAIMQFDATTGALINATFIDLATVTAGAASTPIEAIFADNGEIWVTDQVADTVFRLSADGTTLLGTSTTPLDNMRGGAAFGANVLVTNSGSNNGAPDDALVELDPMGGLVGSAAVGDPFDAEPFTFNGTPGFLVSDISNEDLVFVDGSDLSVQTVFHDSDGVTGIDFPEQVHISATGRIWAAGFSTPSGIYEYDSMGNQIQYIDTSALGFGGLRGIFELPSGDLLFTNGAGVHRYEFGTASVTTLISGVSARFITLEGDGALGSNYCMANVNSSGATAVMSASGTNLVADNDFTLQCDSMPTFAFAFFLTSTVQDFVMNPGSSAGNLCLGGSIGRFVGPGQIQNSGAAGSVSLLTDLNNQPTPVGPVIVAPGETWNYTCWFRDVSVLGTTSNFADGLEVTFQ